MINRYKVLFMVPFIAFSFYCGEESEPAKPYDANQGKAVYEIHCQACHGDEGSGDGLMGLTTEGKPRNYKEEGFVYGSEFTEIRKVIREGTEKGMPAYESILSTDEINAVTMYIRNRLGL